MGQALLRIGASACLALGLATVIYLAEGPLSRIGLWWPCMLGVWMFGGVSIKMASGRHDPGFVPYRTVLGMAGLIGLLVTVAASAAQLLVAGQDVLVKVVVGVVVFVALLLLVLRLYASLAGKARQAP